MVHSIYYFPLSLGIMWEIYCKIWNIVQHLQQIGRDESLGRFATMVHSKQHLIYERVLKGRFEVGFVCFVFERRIV